MKTVIWDFNGTIVNDVELCLTIENDMLRKRGLRSDYTVEEYREMFGFPVIDYYYLMGYQFEDETYAEVSVEFNDLYNRGFSSCTLVRGFEDKIRESREKGYRNVILSASAQDDLCDQCERLGIAHLFDEILGMNNNLAGSKIDMAKNWMKSADIDPADCLYIGDTDHDYETAKAIGIKDIVLVACGHQSFAKLKKIHPNVVEDLYGVKL